MSKVIIDKARNYKIGSYKRVVDHIEAIQYALGVGCNSDPMDQRDLQFTYENSKNFNIIQSYSSIFSVYGLDIIRKCPGLPDYHPMALVHAGQVIKPVYPITIGETVTASNKIIDVEDKRSGALVSIESSIHKEDGTLAAQNIATLFIRGIGGFKSEQDPEPITPAMNFPNPISKNPIEEITLPTAENQAHLYRVASLDLNPLHIDPEESKKGGFERPILHGLCTLGYSTRAYQTVFDHHNFAEIGVRFTAPTVPGQSLHVQFFDTDNENQTAFSTIAFDQDKSVSEGVIVAKGWLEKK
ncbi:unnamed protein product [Moneuplotes crassus]|uniref:Uncharacterized protein n=1 Tax=Euplotes crassus TaxID=5936 RepID=A0AAD1XRA3_EUPCR|nr:unnamed protein product [Moneuplotes crassus]